MAVYQGFKITVTDLGSPDGVGYVAIARIENGVTIPDEIPSGAIVNDPEGASPETDAIFTKLIFDANNGVLTGIKANGNQIVFEPNIDLTASLVT